MKILLVEDEPKLGKATKKGLELDGYAVELVTNADDALRYSEVDNYDLIILDRMLPEGRDGLEVCQIIRQRGWKGPILMLTALTSTEDKVKGLQNGADDYLAKPFAFDELTARLQALLRRPANIVGPILHIGTITIDLGAKQVSKKDLPVSLTKREYLLLEFLAHNQGQIVSKQQIIDHVWSYEADILPNTVEAFVKSLRGKLDDKNNIIIETVRGFGYRLAA